MNVTSHDGTTIAFDVQGDGPPLILIDGAMTTRKSESRPELMALLAPHYTVYSYDRRGRGESTDTQPYAVEREIEDIDALIEHAGGRAFLHGHSSGGCLALRAAVVLGSGKVAKVAAYEAPWNDDPAAQEAWRRYRRELAEAVAGGRRGDAAALFMRYVGTPAEQIAGMREQAFWAGFEAVAPTLLYDAEIMGPAGALPSMELAEVTAPVLAICGGASPAFMCATARSISEDVPNGAQRTIPGQTHAVQPAAEAPVLIDFFGEEARAVTRSVPRSGPGRSGRVNANGIDYYYEIHGEGEPLLALHGGLGSIDLFGPSPLFASGRQVIAVDLQGHGRTPLGDRPISLFDMGDDMAVLLEQLGYRQVDAFGYSLGGGVAFRLAVQHPEMVRRLVLASTGFSQDGFYPEMLPQQAAVSGAVADKMKGTPIYESYMAIAPHPEDFPRLLDRMGEAMRQPYDFSEDVRGLRMPVMLVFGDSDMFRPEHIVEFYHLLGGGLRDAGWMRETMAPNRLAILPDVTHYEMAMAPALVPTVLPFLNGETHAASGSEEVQQAA